MHPTRRSVLKTAAAIAGSAPLVGNLLRAAEPGPLFAYVRTFSSPLGDVPPTQTDAGQVGPTRAAHAPPGGFAVSGHDRPHAHMIQADPAGRFVLHADLGLDKIFVWKFDARTGRLSPNDPPAVALPPGDGPRHFYFHPNGRWLYSIQEEGSTIVQFDYDAATGRLAPRQTVSTLPSGHAGSNFYSEILVSDDGRFVYAGNRLHDHI